VSLTQTVEDSVPPKTALTPNASARACRRSQRAPTRALPRPRVYAIAHALQATDVKNSERRETVKAYFAHVRIYAEHYAVRLDIFVMVTADFVHIVRDFQDYVSPNWCVRRPGDATWRRPALIAQLGSVPISEFHGVDLNYSGMHRFVEPSQ
jgi:hypothetical protein